MGAANRDAKQPAAATRHRVARQSFAPSNGIHVVAVPMFSHRFSRRRAIFVRAARAVSSPTSPARSFPLRDRFAFLFDFRARSRLFGRRSTTERLGSFSYTDSRYLRATISRIPRPLVRFRRKENSSRGGYRAGRFDDWYLLGNVNRGQVSASFRGIRSFRLPVYRVSRVSTTGGSVPIDTVSPS